VTTVKDTVKELVTDALQKQAAKSTASLEKRDVPQVASAVVKEVNAVVEHATNNEPWYQSRVTWGAIISIILPIAGTLGVATDTINPDELVALCVAGGTVVGGILTLYGRWAARKPIGA
jgi:Na+-transporting NADH:ubiquinone oxidoreductase subunit NqrC